MKMPKAAPESTRLFEQLAAGDPRLEIRKLFGQPTAFVQGNMCFGTFGTEVYVRLSEIDRKKAAADPKVRPFEPMPGRPMTEYLVLPPSVLRDRAEAQRWVARSVRYVASLPPKPAKARR